MLFEELAQEILTDASCMGGLNQNETPDVLAEFEFDCTAHELHELVRTCYLLVVEVRARSELSIISKFE